MDVILGVIASIAETPAVLVVVNILGVSLDLPHLPAS